MPFHTNSPGKTSLFIFDPIKKIAIVRKVDELGTMALLASIFEHHTDVGLVLFESAFLLVFYTL